MNALVEKTISKALFISPIVNMERLITDMMSWSNVTEDELCSKKEISTDFGETLSWEYLCYVRKHPINNVLIELSVAAPAVYVIYNRVRSFVALPVWGIRNTIISVVAYNMGAGYKGRVKKLIKIAMRASAGIMVIGTILYETIPALLLRIFSTTDEMLAIGMTIYGYGPLHILHSVFSILCLLDSVWLIFCRRSYSLHLAVTSFSATTFAAGGNSIVSWAEISNAPETSQHRNGWHPNGFDMVF